MAHIPERTCIACRKKGPREEFLRIVWIKDEDAPFDDRDGKAQGRGAYLCRNEKCIALARKKKLLNRAFARPVPDMFYDRLSEDNHDG